MYFRKGRMFAALLILIYIMFIIGGVALLLRKNRDLFPKYDYSR